MEEKLGIIKDEYNIPIEDNIREDVDTMCNLSQGIREEGLAEGLKQARTQIIINMHQKGFSLQQIADIAEISVEEVNAILEGKELVGMF